MNKILNKEIFQGCDANYLRLNEVCELQESED